jgi:TGF-beta propeptide
MIRKFQLLVLSYLCLLVLLATSVSQAQITPSQDAYTNNADATTNFGASGLLDVDGTSQIAYIQFNLASVPSGAHVGQATLKLYVNAVTTAGSFNVDYVNGPWSEGTITHSLSPALGNTIALGVTITAADKNQYILVNVTPAVEAWLGGSQANDGLALVANSAFNASFDSKENTTTSHPPELDLVFASNAGTITGVTTAAGSGLTGGGTTGTLNVSLLKTCANGQVLEWNGTAWACATAQGTGTITGVVPGTGLTGGGTSGKVTLNLNTAKVPQLSSANVFTNNQAIVSPSSSAYGLSVSATNYQGILIEGPETYVGAGLEFATSGTGGMNWQILNTGAEAAQKANKLNFRNDSAGIDVMTMLPSGLVGIGTTSPSGNAQLEVDTTSPIVDALRANGFSAPNGSKLNGQVGILGAGGGGDSSQTDSIGGDGVVGIGGSGAVDGVGGVFDGADSSPSTGSGDGMLAFAGSGAAGAFGGDVSINGSLSKSGGSFKIDHPLDPANKYLYHSFVESPDMMNIYNGNATLDGAGEAVITMPEWFSVLNRDFRYQLTCIGGFAPIYVAEKLANNQFKIGGGKPGMEVSWQITGIRQDAWANAHRIPVEQEKEARLKGFYLHPELYGAPPEKQIEWARHPAIMRRILQHRRQTEARQKQARITASAKP